VISTKNTLSSSENGIFSMIQNNRLTNQRVAKPQETTPTVTSSTPSPKISISTTTQTPSDTTATDSCKIHTQRSTTDTSPVSFLDKGETLSYFGSGFKVEDIAHHLRVSNQGGKDSSQTLNGGEYLKKMAPYELKELKEVLKTQIADPKNCDDSVLKNILLETEKELGSRQPAGPNDRKHVSPKILMDLIG
jgi:hypothetical protein